jgi:hypothetical protein
VRSQLSWAMIFRPARRDWFVKASAARLRSNFVSAAGESADPLRQAQGRLSALLR